MTQLINSTNNYIIFLKGVYHGVFYILLLLGYPKGTKYFKDFK